MSTFIINSARSLEYGIETLRKMFQKDKYVEVTAKAGKVRTLDQNALSHIWYEQLGKEQPEDNALGWKCYCKLHHGIPILRMDDEQFRHFYDRAIKGLTYEEKLEAMKFIPVTSLMHKEQFSLYLGLVQEDFQRRGVLLEFPRED